MQKCATSFSSRLCITKCVTTLHIRLSFLHQCELFLSGRIPKFLASRRLVEGRAALFHAVRLVVTILCANKYKTFIVHYFSKANQKELVCDSCSFYAYGKHFFANACMCVRI